MIKNLPTLIFSLLFLSYFCFNASAEEPKLVEVEKAKKQTFISQASLIGTIASKQEITFAAKFDGILTKIYLKDGSMVKIGDTIAEMENENISDAYELAQQSEKIANEQYQRALKLHQGGYISRAILDDKKQKWNTEKQALVKLKKELSDSIFRAPFDGKLGVFQAKQGAYLKTGEKIIIVYNPNAIVVDLDIPESILSSVKIASVATIFNKKFEISSIQHVINPETRMADAKVELKNLESLKDILIGKQVDVILTLDEKKDALVIPKSALFIKEGKFKVFRVTKDKAELVEVTIGSQNSSSVVITKGLKEGDPVILFGQSNIQNNDIVKIYRK